MCPYQSVFENLIDDSTTIRGIANQTVQVQGRGTVVVTVKQENGSDIELRLRDVCYVPNSSVALISMKQLVTAKGSLVLSVSGSHIKIGGCCIPVNMEKELPMLKSSMSLREMAAHGSSVTPLKTWHGRYAHRSNDTIKAVLEKNEIKYMENGETTICEPCLAGKMKVCGMVVISEIIGYEL